MGKDMHNHWYVPLRAETTLSVVVLDHCMYYFLVRLQQFPVGPFEKIAHIQKMSRLLSGSEIFILCSLVEQNR